MIFQSFNAICVKSDELCKLFVHEMEDKVKNWKRNTFTVPFSKKCESVYCNCIVVMFHAKFFFFSVKIREPFYYIVTVNLGLDFSN